MPTRPKGQRFEPGDLAFGLAVHWLQEERLGGLNLSSASFLAHPPR